MSENSVHCLFCDSDNSSKIYDLINPVHPERYYSIYRCHSCHLTYLHPIPTEEDINQLFQDLYRQENPFLPELAFYFSENKSPEHIASIEKEFNDYLDILEFYHPKGKILDLGCGEGSFLNVAKTRGWIPHGVDSSKDAVQRAYNKFSITVTQSTAESVDFPAESFDVVTLLDFAEHLSFPKQTYKNIHRWLKPGGVMLIATPNQASILAWAAHIVYLVSFKSIKGPLYRIYMLPHFLYYTPPTIRNILEKTGFRISMMKKTNTDLRRLHLHPLMRFNLMFLFALANIAGLQNRITLIAQKPIKSS